MKEQRTSSAAPGGLDLEKFARRDGVWQLSGAGAFDGHQERYLEVRGREGRLLPDETVRRLPTVPPDHPQAVEWRVRAWSLGRLQSYLENRPDPKVILDVGCGSGWMSARLSESPGRLVYGLDLNQQELVQGARVFAQNPRLHFLFADVMGETMSRARVDLVLLAGSVQYFPDLAALLPRLLSLLRPGGELHIIDSPFYQSTEDAAQARARSSTYYRGLGCPEMAAHYHHHCFHQLEPFGYQLLHDPSRLLSRFRRRISRGGESPFPWIRMRA